MVCVQAADTAKAQKEEHTLGLIRKEIIDFFKAFDSIFISLNNFFSL